jgi:hypothetical protein
VKNNWLSVTEEEDKPESKNEKQIKVLSLKTSENLKSIEAKVNGIKIKAFLDTGAEMSVMSERAAKKYNIPVYESDIKVKVANNAEEKIIGFTDKLEINVANNICELQLAVIPHDDHEILLGLDWFNETYAGFYPNRNIVRLAGKTIFTNNSLELVEAEDIETVDLCTVGVADEEEFKIGYDIEEIAEPKIQPEMKLDKEGERQFEELKSLIEEAIPRSPYELGEYSQEEINIQMTDDEPVYRNPYRKSDAENEKIEKKIQIMLKAGLIEESRSSYSSPILSIPKKDGSIRIVQDYRFVNKKIKDLPFQMPTIPEVIDAMAGCKYFSSIDLDQGFSQLKLNKKSREITAFSTTSGHYQYRRCPQGIKTGPAMFANAMEKALRTCKKFARNYLDDTVDPY